MKEISIKEIQELQLRLMRIVHKVCCEHDIKYYLISGSCLGAVRHGGFIPWDDDIDIAMMRPDYEKFISGFNAWFDTDAYFLQNEWTDLDFTVPLSRICIRGTMLEEPWAEHLRYDKSMFMDVFPLDNVPDDDTLRIKHDKAIKFYKSLIARKVYTTTSNKIYNLAKWVISKILKILPLSYLLKRRYKIHTKYAGENTRCVSSLASKYGYKKHIMSREIYGTPRLLQFENEEFYFPEKYTEHLVRLFGEKYMELPPVEKREKPTTAYLI